MDTLHLERDSPPADHERAVDILAGISPYLQRAELCAALAAMFKEAATASPIEIRVGAPDAPPLLILYPTTRAEGERVLAQETRDGMRMVTQVSAEAGQ